MIELTIGRPGSCKSLDQARVVSNLLKRAFRIEKKYGYFRKIYVNLHFNVQDKYKKYLEYYDDLYTLTTKKDCDIVIDEVAVYLPCDKWKDTHFEIRRMLAQHRKRGIEIYANTQDYRMVDINFRRMIHRVFSVHKIIGNRDPSSTMPPIKHIWGIYIKRELDPEEIEDENEKKSFGLPFVYLIERGLVDMYDTREDIKAVAPPKFHHYERTCEDENCTFHKTFHI